MRVISKTPLHFSTFASVRATANEQESQIEDETMESDVMDAEGSLHQKPRDEVMNDEGSLRQKINEVCVMNPLAWFENTN